MSFSSNFIQTTEFEAYDIIPVNVSDLLTGTGSVDVVDVSETGILIALAVVVTTTVTGTPTSVIEITVDGGTLRTILLYTGGGIWDVSGFGGLLNHTDNIGIGSTANHRGVLWMGGSRYASALKISHNVSGTGSAGAIELQVIRGVKL